MKTAKLLFPLPCRAKSRRDGTLLTVCDSLRAILLSALLFFFCANLNAQVTIGSLEEPKSGAVLDLNSTLKGGLLLSNVVLLDLYTIPYAGANPFPGVTATNYNLPGVKDGFEGAMVYHTGGNSIPAGVYVWNGKNWTPIKQNCMPLDENSVTLTHSPDPIAVGENVVFSVSSGASPFCAAGETYEWSRTGANDHVYVNFGGSTADVSTSFTASGTYGVKVKVTSPYSSAPVSKEVNFLLCSAVTMPTLLTSSTLPNELTNTPFALSVSIPVGGNADYTLQWYRKQGGDAFAAIAGSNAASINQQESTAGTYEYYCKIWPNCSSESGNFTQQSPPITVTVWNCSAAPATPGTISLSATTINLNGTFTASVPEVSTGTQIPTSYAWNLPAGLTGTSTERSITITGAAAGTYTIKVTASNDCGTSAEQSTASAITVKDCTGAPATPTLSITATTINRNGTTTLSCTNVGNGATSYEWTLPPGLTGSSATNTIVITGATAGTYNASAISVKATNACGSTTATGSGDAITVSCTGAPATPTLSITAKTINRNSTTTLSCTNVGDGATIYEWTLPAGLTGSSTTNTITVTGVTVGKYNANSISVKATNDCGNTSATGSGGAISVVNCSGAIVYNGAYNGPAAGTVDRYYSGDFEAGWTVGVFTAQNKSLCWTASDISVAEITWSEAKTECAKSRDGNNNWRLPNLKELQVLYEAIGGTGGSATALTALDTRGTGNSNGASAMLPAEYWSSTEFSDWSAYRFHFNEGSRRDNLMTNFRYVRCVRSLAY